MRKSMEQAGLCIGRDGFTLPLDLVTSTQAILARKRSGKSYTASVEAEELLRLGQQIAVIDPTGAWWGLRSSASGDGPGYPVVVFGGEHADAPLDAGAGRMLAAAAIEHGFSAIFDVSVMDVEDQLRFVSDFARELLRLNRAALHLFIDEADVFAPQQKMVAGQKESLGAVSRLVKQGGIQGVGVTMITQRPQDINKMILSQVDLLVVLRMSQNTRAVTDWIEQEVSPEFARVVADALPSLPVGTAFVCSASRGIGERVEVRARWTYNSGATPVAGERKAEPRVLAAVDIERLGREIAASARQAQESSPEFLRKRVAELEAGSSAGGAKLGEVERLEAEIVRLRAELAEAHRAREEQAAVVLAAAEMLRQLTESLSSPKNGAAPLSVLIKREAEPPAEVGEAPPTPRRSRKAPLEQAGVGKGLPSRILRAVAEFRSIGRTAVPRSTLSAWARARGGHFTNTLGSLRTAGLVEYPSPGAVALTKQGSAAAPKVGRPPDAEALFEACCAQVGSGLPERVLRVLHKKLPQSVTRDALSELVGARGGHFTNTLGSLHTAGFVEYPARGTVRLAAWTCQASSN